MSIGVYIAVGIVKDIGGPIISKISKGHESLI